MAIPPSDDSPKPKKRGTSVLVWVLLAVMAGSLGSFGVTNFSGSSIQRIGTVGDEDVRVTDFAAELRQQLTEISQQFGQQITLSQAQAIGLALDQQALQATLNRAALSGEAARIGISVGDPVVAAQLAGIQAFQGVAGTFDTETYKFALQQNNLTAREFEDGIRKDAARTILQNAVVAGIVAPQVVTDSIYAWAAEARSFSWLSLTEADLPAPLPAPTEAELQAHYDSNIASYTRPEAKRITYIALLPETLAPTLPVDEAAVKALYDARSDQYLIPEKRLVERLVYPTEAEAAAAKARLDAGESFETLVAERGLALEDIDLGDVSQADLGEAGAAVFALTEPGVTGPLMSTLGPALFRMNAILAAQETPFDTVKADLTREVQTAEAVKAIGDRLEEIDDLLAGGETLENLAREEGLTLATTDYAPGADDNDPITDFAKFRAAADALAEGDFPEAILLDDGSLAALRLDETLPPTPRPFDTVKDQVTEAVRAEMLAKALADHAQTIKAAVEGGASLGAYGITSVVARMTRDGSLPGAPASAVTKVFALTPGEVALVEEPGFTALVQLTGIIPAEAEGEDAAALRDAIDANSRRGIAQDLFQLYTEALTSEAGVSLDQTAINAVLAQFN
jgi:peptidyl-prolyl cis-trans isomerase D